MAMLDRAGPSSTNSAVIKSGNSNAAECWIRTTRRPPGEGRTHQWGDQGDGTYRNPILPDDFSDLDVIRVGDDRTRR